MTTLADSITEVHYVKFCPHCGSDNVDPHPDDLTAPEVYEGENLEWWKCMTCNHEFQTFEALAGLPDALTLWNNRKDS